MINSHNRHFVWGFGDEVDRPTPRWNPENDVKRLERIGGLQRLYKMHRHSQIVNMKTYEDAIALWKDSFPSHQRRSFRFLFTGSTKPLYRHSKIIMALEYSKACKWPLLRFLDFVDSTPDVTRVDWPPKLYFCVPGGPTCDMFPRIVELTAQFIK